MSFESRRVAGKASADAAPENGAADEIRWRGVNALHATLWARIRFFRPSRDCDGRFFIGAKV